MRTWLRSDNALLVLLALALAAQTPHTAALFHRLAPAADGALVYAGWLHAWAYAIALESAILLFVMRGKTGISWGFAIASVLVNTGYYYTPELTLADALRAALVSLVLPGAIALYSHEVAHDESVAVADTLSKPSVPEHEMIVSESHAEHEVASLRVVARPVEAFGCVECGATFHSARALNGHVTGHKRRARQVAAD